MKNPVGLITLQLGVAIFLTACVVLSRYFAPLAASHMGSDASFLLNWGAPAVFAGQEQEHLANRLEPWRLLGVTMPVFAGLNPPAQPSLPVFDNPPIQDNPVVSPPQTNLAGITVGIYHSHTTESFVPSFGKERSLDPSENVIRLGEQLAGILSGNSATVLHRRDFHDAANYNRSYINSYVTMTEMLAQAPEMTLLLDIHRDAINKNHAISRQKATVRIKGRDAGKIAFVIGTGHDNWRANNALATALHLLTEERYPGLSRGIIHKFSSFNQELHPGAILVEVGDYTSTIEEAEYGLELFAQVLIEFLQGGWQFD